MEKDSKVTATTNGKASAVLDKVEEKKLETVKEVKNETSKMSEDKLVETKPAAKAKVKKEDTVIDEKAVEEIKEVSKKTVPKKKTAKTEKETKAKAPTKKKESTKKAATKTKNEVVDTIKVSTYIQYFGKEITQSELIEKVKEDWIAQGNDEKSIKNLELYVKPEEGAVYYVVNGIPDSGKIEF